MKKQEKKNIHLKYILVFNISFFLFQSTQLNGKFMNTKCKLSIIFQNVVVLTKIQGTLKAA